jgi:Tfp pilus assembly protein PilV
MSKRYDGFTLGELLVAMSVLTLLVLLFAHLINSATTTTTLANKRMDADAVSRPLLDRLAADFASMVKRNDVSCYAKNAGTLASMTGNDLIAFYGATVGYFPTNPSPVSVIAYRVNSDSSNSRAYNRLERMAKGLDWNGASADKAVLFLPFTIDDSAAWPSVASGSAYDSTDPTQITYEVIGSQIFRFEYYFVEKSSGTLTAFPATWTSSANVKLSEVSAIVVAIAVIDAQSQVLLTNSQIAALATSLPDYNSSMGPGQLLARWQSVLDSTATLPRTARSGIRLYERYYSLAP